MRPASAAGPDRAGWALRTRFITSSGASRCDAFAGFAGSDRPRDPAPSVRPDGVRGRMR